MNGSFAQPIKTVTWGQDDEKGALLMIGMEKEPASVVLVTEKGVWVLEELDRVESLDSINLQRIASWDETHVKEKWGSLYSLCFDLKGRAYLSTEKAGVIVFADRSLNNQIACIDNFRGPINLSHPSTTIIGINHMSGVRFGVFCDMGWKAESEGGEEKFMMLERNYWGADMGSWLSGDLGPSTCLRRAWYPPSLQMVYMVDENSKKEPLDGVRALWLNRAQSTVNHTLISSPTPEGLPFALEIPHGSVGEVTFVSPMGMAVSGSKIKINYPEFDKTAKYNWCLSATNCEGRASERTFYCTAFEKETSDTKTWSFVLSRRLD